MNVSLDVFQPIVSDRLDQFKTRGRWSHEREWGTLYPFQPAPATAPSLPPSLSQIHVNLQTSLKMKINVDQTGFMPIIMYIFFVRSVMLILVLHVYNSFSYAIPGWPRSDRITDQWQRLRGSSKATDKHGTWWPDKSDCSFCLHSDMNVFNLVWTSRTDFNDLLSRLDNHEGRWID